MKKGWTPEKMQAIKLSESRRKCCEKHEVLHCAFCKPMAEAFHCQEWTYFEIEKLINTFRRRQLNLIMTVPKFPLLPKSNMYKLSVKQWNPYVGCEYNCSYCKPSFQAQCKRFGKKRCPKCYQYKPHFHPERLQQRLPRTGYMQFIFCCSTGDIAFCPTDYLLEILEVIKKYPDRWFLIQSKNPETFNRVTFPRNVILGTTIETNLHRLKKPTDIHSLSYNQISKAPHPSKRILDFQTVEHKFKMLTYEPLLACSIPVMVHWAELINPCMIWMGYDSKNTGLPEPIFAEFLELHWELARRGFVVILKTIRRKTRRQ